MDRPPLAPFALETVGRNVRFAGGACNCRNPSRGALTHSADSRWRSRAAFLPGRQPIEGFLVGKWQWAFHFRLIKEFRGRHDHRMAARLASEWHDGIGCWSRSCGSENREFDEHRKMRVRHASLNDAPNSLSERRCDRPAGALPRRFLVGERLRILILAGYYG